MVVLLLLSVFLVLSGAVITMAANAVIHLAWWSINTC